MEQKNDVTNSDYINNNTIKDKNSNLGMKKFQTKKKIIIQKMLEPNNLTILNDSKKKQKQIKQCFNDLIKTKEKKEKNLKKDSEKIFNPEHKEEKEKLIIKKDMSINQVNLKNKFDIKSKDIKVNKIKIEKNNKEKINNTNNNINKDLYKNSNKHLNLVTEESTTNSHKYLSDCNNNKATNTNSKTNSIGTNKIPGKTLSNNDLMNDNLINPEYINLKKEYSDFSLSDNNNKNNNKYNISTNTYSNTTEGKSKSKLSTNSSKIFLSFKNIKTIYAHFEIFKCLYLKRTFIFFLEQLNNYINLKNPNKNIESHNIDSSEGNNFRIINSNNSNCSLFYSINLSKDKLYNTINDNQYIKNTLTPKKNRDYFENMKHGKINTKRNRMLYLNQDNDKINLDTKKNFEKIDNKSIYVPKKKLSKGRIDVVNKKKSSKKVLSSKDINFKRSNNNLKSPIKELNINLKQINVCRLNDLNQLYSKQNFFKSDNMNYNFPGINQINTINPLITIDDITNHNRYNSNNIISINTNSNYYNLSKEKFKFKKIKSVKNGIYIKPKDKNVKKKIKEIKIQNKLSPIRKDMENHRRNYNKMDNIDTINNSLFDKNMIDAYKTNDLNLNTIYYNREPHIIKKIYINRNSKGKCLNNFSVKNNILNINKNNFYSTYLNFNSENEKNINNNEFLVKQIITNDNRVFIRIKYIFLINNNFVNNQKKLFNILNFIVIHQYSIAIINNKILLNKEIENYILLQNSKSSNKKPRFLDIYSFDNIEKKIRENIKPKNISFSFKEFSISKGENHDMKNMVDNLINFIKVLKNIIIKSIRKYIYINYKRKLFLKKLIYKKNNKIIYYYFLKLKNNQKITKIKLDKNNYGIYHKINYNDDFNLNKKLKSPKNNIKNTNVEPISKIKPNYLNSHNPTKQYNNRNKINDKKKLKEISSNEQNYKNSNKIMNKEINIIVHNNNISFNNFKKKILMLRIKLISNALKKKTNMKLKMKK